jgi:hypothetical protein
VESFKANFWKKALENRIFLGIYWSGEEFAAVLMSRKIFSRDRNYLAGSTQDLSLPSGWLLDI